MYQLSNFSSAFEVSVGIHLLYKKFPDLSNHFKKKHKKIIQDTKTYASMFENEKDKEAKYFKNVKP